MFKAIWWIIKLPFRIFWWVLTLMPKMVKNFGGYASTK